LIQSLTLADRPPLNRVSRLQSRSQDPECVSERAGPLSGVTVWASKSFRRGWCVAALLLTIGAVACGSSEGTATATGSVINGYPGDHSLTALVNGYHLDNIITVENIDTR